MRLFHAIDAVIHYVTKIERKHLFWQHKRTTVQSKSDRVIWFGLLCSPKCFTLMGVKIVCDALSLEKCNKKCHKYLFTITSFYKFQIKSKYKNELFVVRFGEYSYNHNNPI